MIRVEVKVDKRSLAAAIKAFDDVSGKLRGAALIAAVQDAIDILYAEAQARVPVDKGDLKKSMDRFLTDIRPGAGVVSGKVTMSGRGRRQLPYAWMREEGGVIRPKTTNKHGFLVWEGADGKPIFAREVHQKGSHYMAGALDASKKEIVEAMRKRLEGAIR